MSKFDSGRDEVLYTLVGTNWGTDSGSVEAPQGWFASLAIVPGDLDSLDAVDLELVHELEVDVNDLVGYFLIRENSDGLVDVKTFDTEQELATVYLNIEKDYVEWASDDEPAPF